MTKVKDYISRLAEQTLLTKLNSSGCVVVTGSKFCGKSTMCEEFAKSVTALGESGEPSVILLSWLTIFRTSSSEKPIMIT